MKIEFSLNVGCCHLCEAEEIDWQVTNYKNKAITVDLRCLNEKCLHSWRYDGIAEKDVDKNIKEYMDKYGIDTRGIFGY